MEILKLERLKVSYIIFIFFVERPLIEIVAMMEINGCKINNEHLEKPHKFF